MNVCVHSGLERMCLCRQFLQSLLVFVMHLRETRAHMFRNSMLVCTEQQLSLPLPDGRLAAFPAGVDRPPDQKRDSDPGSGGCEYCDPVGGAEALEGECDEEGDHANVKSPQSESCPSIEIMKKWTYPHMSKA